MEEFETVLSIADECRKQSVAARRAYREAERRYSDVIKVTAALAVKIDKVLGNPALSPEDHALYSRMRERLNAWATDLLWEEVE